MNAGPGAVIEVNVASCPVDCRIVLLQPWVSEDHVDIWRVDDVRSNFFLVIVDVQELFRFLSRDGAGRAPREDRTG